MSLRSAGSAVFNVFGELAVDDEVPTATVVHALGVLGHEPQAARQALTRGQQAGWLEAGRAAGNVRWSLSDAGRRLVEDGVRRVEALASAPAVWDGRWMVLVTSIPQRQRSSRPRLYRSLTWAGFGSPTPGLWVSPHPDRAPAVERSVDRLDLAGTTMSFVGPAGGIGLDDGEIVERAWSLDEIDERYARLVTDFAARDPVDDAAALRELLALDQELQRLPALDPQLPVPLTGPRPGRDCAARLLELRAAWRRPALAYWARLRGEG